MITVATGIPERSEHLTIKATVSDVDPVPLRYSRNIVIVPDSIVVEYTRVGFEPWKIKEVTVSGGKLLKSGKASDNPLSRHDTEMTMFERFHDDAPVRSA